MRDIGEPLPLEYTSATHTERISPGRQITGNKDAFVARIKRVMQDELGGPRPKSADLSRLPRGAVQSGPTIHTVSAPATTQRTPRAVRAVGDPLPLRYNKKTPPGKKVRLRHVGEPLPLNYKKAEGLKVRPEGDRNAFGISPVQNTVYSTPTPTSPLSAAKPRRTKSSGALRTSRILLRKLEEAERDGDEEEEQSQEEVNVKGEKEEMCSVLRNSSVEKPKVAKKPITVQHVKVEAEKPKLKFEQLPISETETDESDKPEIADAEKNDRNEDARETELLVPKPVIDEASETKETAAEEAQNTEDPNNRLADGPLSHVTNDHVQAEMASQDEVSHLQAGSSAKVQAISWVIGSATLLCYLSYLLAD